MVLPSESRRAVFERLRASMGAGALPAPDRWPTGIAVLDAALGGGLRRGSLVLVGGVPGSGRWSLIAALLRTVTASAWAAILDDGSLYPPGLVRAGVRLERRDHPRDGLGYQLLPTSVPDVAKRTFL
jgi:hypothetical protein